MQIKEKKRVAQEAQGGLTPASVPYYTIKDVMRLQGVKEAKAGQVIRNLNAELEAKGYLPFPKGKVPKKYYHERYGDQ